MAMNQVDNSVEAKMYLVRRYSVLSSPRNVLGDGARKNLLEYRRCRALMHLEQSVPMIRPAQEPFIQKIPNKLLFDKIHS